MLEKERGAVILIIIFVLLGAISLLTLYSVNSGIIGGHTVANEYPVQQAFEAAAAGLDYGVVYLEENNDSILVDSDSDGYINSNSFSQTLNNSTNFTVSFTNPTANDFDLIKITATGTSADGKITKQMSELVKFTRYLQYIAPLTVVSRGEVELKGSVMVRNLFHPTTIWSGDDVDIKGSAHTESNDGSGSTKSYTHTDIVADDSSLDDLSSDSFFSNFFGVSKEIAKSRASLYFSNNRSKTYNDDLDEKTGEFIWIDQTSKDAKISGNTVIGSLENPVILVVDGDLKISGNATIYGFIFATGDLDVKGTVQIEGGVAAGGDTDISGNVDIIYNNEVVNELNNFMGKFGIVSGSWKDF